MNSHLLSPSQPRIFNYRSLGYLFRGGTDEPRLVNCIPVLFHTRNQRRYMAFELVVEFHLYEMIPNLLQQGSKIVVQSGHNPASIRPWNSESFVAGVELENVIFNANAADE